MSVEPRMAFLGAQMLGAEGSVEGTLQHIRAQGFGLGSFTTGGLRNLRSSWETYPDIKHSGFGTVYANQQLSFRIQHTQTPLCATVSLYWDTYQYAQAVSYQTRLFRTDQEDAVKYSRVFLGLGKCLFDTLAPDFGWCDFSEPSGSTWFDDVDSLEFPYVYWANFLGARYVEKYGRKYLTDCPGTETQDLRHNGVLLVLAESMSYGYHTTRDAVVAYLGEFEQP